MKLLLVRHGRNQLGPDGATPAPEDPGLTPPGHAQAAVLARALAGVENMMALYSSPMARARETAQPISHTLRLPLGFLDGLAERDLGPLEGVAEEEIRARYPAYMTQWDRNPAKAALAGVEPLAELQDRVWRAVQDLAKVHTQGSVVAVSHNYPIMMAICKVLNLPISRFRSFDIDLASISTIELNDEGARLIALNDLCHLSRDSRSVQESPALADVRG